MSVGATRDQKRAILAHQHIIAVQDKGEKFYKKYGSMSLKLPILLHTAGLVAALHFVAARGKAPQRLILEHLAQQLGDAGLLKQKDSQGLLQASREADLARTRSLTREVQRCLLWYKRFTQSVLRVASTEDALDAGDGIDDFDPPTQEGSS